MNVTIPSEMPAASLILLYRFESISKNSHDFLGNQLRWDGGNLMKFAWLSYNNLGIWNGLGSQPIIIIIFELLNLS